MSYRGYIPNFTPPFQLVLPSRPTEQPIVFGTQDPEGVVPGAPGQYYVNTNTMRMWLKLGGVQELGWKEVGIYVPGGEGGGGGGTVLAGSYDNPNGLILAAAPALYYSFNGTVWAKGTTQLSTEGWYQLIG
jgi:hypothetical protein